jgi:hypothetical protein
MPCFAGWFFSNGVLEMEIEFVCEFECWRLTIAMATVLALEAGGFLIVTLPIERTMARVMRTICTIWTSVFRRSSKRLFEFIMFQGYWLGCRSLVVRGVEAGVS